MATIARMVAEIGADPSGLYAGLRASTAALQQFSQEAARQMGRVNNFATASDRASAFFQSQLQTHRNFLARLTREYESAEASIKEGLARGLISPEQAVGPARAAAIRFNEEILDRLTNDRSIPRVLQVELINALKEAGITGGAEFESRISRAAQTAANKFRAAQELIAKQSTALTGADVMARQQLFSGALTPEQYRAQAAANAKAYNDALLARIAKLDAKGVFPPETRALLVNSLKDAGLEAGKAYQAALASQALKGPTAAFTAATALQRQQRFAGALSAKQYEDQGRIAARVFNESLLREIASLERRGLMTPELRAQLVAEFKDAGLRSGQSFADAAAARIKAVQEKFKAVADNLNATGRTLSLAVTAPLLAAGGAAVKLAGDAEASAMRMRSEFGGSVAEINRQLQALHGVIPVTSTDLESLAATTQAFLLSLRFSPQAAAQMTAQILRLGADISAFKGLSISTEEAVNKITAALIGQTRGIHLLGVGVSENTIRAEAQRRGYLKYGEVLNTVGHAQIAFNQILQGTIPLQGSAARMSELTNKQIAFLQRDLKEAAIVIGQQLIPVLVPLIKQFAAFVRQIHDVNPALLRAVLGAAAFAAAAGPLLRLLGSLTTAVGFLVRAIMILRGPAALAGLGALLTPSGLVIAGLAIVAAAFAYGALRTTEAERALNAYRASLRGMTEEQLINAAAQATAMQAGLDAQRAFLESAIREREKLQGPSITRSDLGPGVVEDKELTRLRRDLKSNADQAQVLQERLGAVMQAFARLRAERAQAAADAARQQQLYDQMLKGMTEPRVTTTKPRSATDLLLDESRKQIELIRQAEGAEGGYATQLEAALALQDRITAAINAQKTSTRDQGRLLAANREITEALLAAIGRVKMPEVPKVDLSDFQLLAPELNRQIEDLGALMKQADVARRLGDRPLAAQLTRQVQEGLGTVATGITQLQRLLDQLHLPREAVLKILEELDEALRKAGIDVDALRRKLLRLGSGLDPVIAGVGALEGVLSVFTNMNRAVLQVVNSVGQLLSSIKSLQTATSLADKISAIGGIGMGALGAISGVISLVTAPSQSDLARQAAVKGNTEALHKLTAELHSTRVTSTATDAARQVGAAFLRAAGNNIGGPLFQASNTAQLLGLMKQYGLSLEQLRAIQDRYGVTLVDANGAFVGTRDSVKKFVDAMGVATTVMFKFSDSVDSQRQLMELRQRTSGVDVNDPAQQLKNALALLQSFAPNLFTQVFAGINTETALATAEGRAQIRAAVGRIVELMAAPGGLDPALAGTLTSFDELTGILTGILDPLDQLGETAAKVTSEMIGIPKGFKVALAAFNAADVTSQIVDNVTRLTSGGGLPGTTSLFNPPTVVVRDPVLAPRDRGAPTTTGDVYTFEAGSITVVGAEKTADELYDDFRTSARDRARRRYGTPTGASRTLNI